MDETLAGKKQFGAELILALIITGLVCAAGQSTLLFAPNDMYPMTADAMGHMAKVRFMADSFSNGIFPAWFPYWYNGTALIQYYPPLSYWVMAPIFMITDNAMLTFKIDCGMMIFIGGMGIWYFCRSHIGYWCGLIGTFAYCLQPFILRSLYSAGQLAQGPIIALVPWYITAMLAYGNKPNSKNFFLCTFLCALMILSHPNTTFMNCICIMAVFLVFIALKKITFQNYCIMLLTIIFAGTLTAFWSLVGVTQLENPGVPFLLPEAVAQHTATIKWFTESSGGWFFFAAPVSIGSIAATLLFIASVKKLDKDKRYYVLFAIIITYITAIFSFGLNLPFFKYLPMSESLAPGRILTLTSASGAILCAYFIHGVQKASEKKRVIIKIPAYLVCLSAITEIGRAHV